MSIEKQMKEHDKWGKIIFGKKYEIPSSYGTLLHTNLPNGTLLHRNLPLCYILVKPIYILAPISVTVQSPTVSRSAGDSSKWHFPIGSLADIIYSVYMITSELHYVTQGKLPILRSGYVASPRQYPNKREYSTVPWPQSTSELYRPNDGRLWAK
jgi:hypothetical protein